MKYWGLPKKEKARRRRARNAQNSKEWEAWKSAARTSSILADRFVKILGLLSSEHAGERDAACDAVEKLRQQNGLTWQQIIRVAIETPKAKAKTLLKK
jgi:2-methylcitrate dehydratase PrpD